MFQNFENLEHFVRLQEEQDNYLKICNRKLNDWLKYKNDYNILKNRLENLPFELRYEVMVPISKVAFMEGRLVNTNEILVLLGDNWFVEKSSKQSCDLIDRRLKNIEKFIEDLQREKNNLVEQINWTKNLLKEKGEYVNIEEKYEETQPKSCKIMSDEEKRELRKKLQEKALKTSIEVETEIKNELQSLYKLKENVKVSNEKGEDEEEEKEDDQTVEVINSGQNFMAKLEEDIKNLDLGEKYEEDEEFMALIKDYEKGINRDNNLKVEQAIKKQSKQVKWSDVEENKEKISDQEDDEYEDYNETETDEEYEESIRTEPIKIQIKHTKNEFIDEQDRRLKLSRDKPELNSPSDIFNIFYKPKSILKKTSSTSFDQEYLKNVEPKKEPINAEFAKFEPQKAFTGEIIEKNVSITTSQLEQEVKRPVSRFKASKFSQNN